jgi:hypothetical protein
MEDKYMRPVVIGAVIGGIAAAMMVMGVHLPNALAREEPFHTALSSLDQLLPEPISTDNLVRFADADWAVSVAPGVSLTPIHSALVTKIGFGHRKLVQISTTASGVYSSDAITSPYVKYPGIHVTRLAQGAGDSDVESLAYWSPRRGWVPSPALTGGSVVTVVPFKGGAVILNDGRPCVLTRFVASC